MKLSEIQKTKTVSNYYGNGIFIKKGTIKEVVNLSNHPDSKTTHTFISGFVPELCLHLLVDIEQDFTQHIYLFGNYYRDKNNKIIGWKIKNSPIVHFLYEFFGDIDIPDNWEMPANVQYLKDVPIVYLQYCVGEYNGKPSFTTFPFVLKDEKDADLKLLEIFNNQATYLISKTKNSYKPDFYENYLNSKKSENMEDVLPDNVDNDSIINDLPF